jgi:dihydrofolate reductase
MTLRRLRYSVAMSLDGFIADEQGGYAWIPENDHIDFAAYLSKIDALIMGRHTYELLVAHDQVGGFADFALYVVSMTLDPAEHPDVTIVSDDVEGFTRDLKKREGKDIWLFGGGKLFRSLLQAGLVDRVEVGVIPVLLGGGVPLLPGFDGFATLRLHSVEDIAGVVLMKYDVEREPAD